MVFALAELDRDKTGMGTTISALLVAGRLRGHGAGRRQPHLPGARRAASTQITEDHTLIAWQIEARPHLGRRGADARRTAT